jgi:sortase (surface protein transpeptidase)
VLTDGRGRFRPLGLAVLLAVPLAAAAGLAVRLAPAAPGRPPSPAGGSDRVAPLPPAEPARLRIPAIGVTAPVRPLGLAADGTMQPPAGNDLAGWYRGSPAPGALGPAVIAGHVDSRHGPAVFFRLRELRPGDRVLVDRVDGTTAVFRVDLLERHPKTAFPTRRAYGDIDHAGLRLITCTGRFDRAAGSYRDNLIVYASLVEGAR